MLPCVKGGPKFFPPNNFVLPVVFLLFLVYSLHSSNISIYIVILALVMLFFLTHNISSVEQTHKLFLFFFFVSENLPTLHLISVFLLTLDSIFF